MVLTLSLTTLYAGLLPPHPWPRSGSPQAATELTCFLGPIHTELSLSRALAFPHVLLGGFLPSRV